MKFHFVKNMLEVLDFALLAEKAKKPVDLMEQVRKSAEKPSVK